jgi:hypothetical protein
VVGGARQGWYPRLEQEVKEAGWVWVWGAPAVVVAPFIGSGSEVRRHGPSLAGNKCAIDG